MRYILLLLILVLLASCGESVVQQQPETTLPSPVDYTDKKEEDDDLVDVFLSNEELMEIIERRKEELENWILYRDDFRDIYKGEPHVTIFRLRKEEFLMFIEYPSEELLFEMYEGYTLTKLSPREGVLCGYSEQREGEYTVVDRIGTRWCIQVDYDMVAFIISEDRLNTFLRENGEDAFVEKSYVVSCTSSLSERKIPPVVWLQTSKGDYYITIDVDVTDGPPFEFSIRYELRTPEQYFLRYLK